MLRAVFTKTHEWLRPLPAGTYELGVTAYAQAQLGEVVYAELPKVGNKYSRNAVLATLESVKAVGEVFSPVDLTVTAINENLKKSPNLVNQDPQGEGWLIHLTPSTPLPESFLTEQQYKDYCNQ